MARDKIRVKVKLSLCTPGRHVLGKGGYKVPFILNILASATRDTVMETNSTSEHTIQLIFCSGLETNFCVRICFKWTATKQNWNKCAHSSTTFFTHMWCLPWHYLFKALAWVLLSQL